MIPPASVYGLVTIGKIVSIDKILVPLLRRAKGNVEASTFSQESA